LAGSDYGGKAFLFYYRIIGFKYGEIKLFSIGDGFESGRNVGMELVAHSEIPKWKDLYLRVERM